MEQTLRIGGIMDLDLDMRSSDKKLLIESCINFYAEKLNIRNKNFILILVHLYNVYFQHIIYIDNISKLCII